VQAAQVTLLVATVVTLYFLQLPHQVVAAAQLKETLAIMAVQAVAVHQVVHYWQVVLVLPIKVLQVHL
jgi:hypothetical protein